MCIAIGSWERASRRSGRLDEDCCDRDQRRATPAKVADGEQQNVAHVLRVRVRTTACGLKHVGEIRYIGGNLECCPLRLGDNGWRPSDGGRFATARPNGNCRRLHIRLVADRSEEHTSELQSLMRISYAVFCLKKKNNTKRSKLI